MLYPGQAAPALKVETLAHGGFDLTRDGGAQGTLVVFYRGLHCPICTRQMAEVESKLDVFTAMGVEVLMLSCDPADKARETARQAGVSALKVGHSFDTRLARDDWGLWVSKAREGTQDPDFFFEPGHFFIGADNAVFMGWVQTLPQARPQIDDIAGAIRGALDNGLPPRGMYMGKLPGEG